MFNCDCDTVLELEEIHPGVEELLQYAWALMTREEIQNLRRGLELLLVTSEEPGTESSATHVTERPRSREAVC